jgi:hypothetical protein
VNYLHLNPQSGFLFMHSCFKFFVFMCLLQGLLDDRFFFGKRDAMIKFSKLYDSFTSLYNKQTNSPERMLYKFVYLQNGFTMGPVYDFVDFAQFEVNTLKYSTKFKASIESQLGLDSMEPRTKEERLRACAHIRSPLAHNQCMQIE